MTYGLALFVDHGRNLSGEAVSHLAELVRGDFDVAAQGPLIRPFGATSPQGEKDRCGEL